MKLLLFSGNTASNIGNQFFYDGVKYALKKLIPEVEITDGVFPMANAYSLNHKYESNLYDFSGALGDLDGIVISGPVLDKKFGHFFEKTLLNARKLNKKIYLLSVGGRKYDAEEISHCEKLLAEIKPDILVSRDTDTYNNYRHLAKNAYDGICFAFFVSDYFKGYNTPELKYICSAFDFTNEPDFQIVDDGAEVKINKSNVTTKSFLNKLKYVMQRDLPEQVSGVDVIRLCHRPLRNKHVMFHKKNIVVSHSSDPYLNLYKNGQFTITDRLHAAVATLAFGKPARLFLESNRVKLIERAGVNDCLNKMSLADLKYIADEKGKMLSWLKNVL